MRDQRDDIPARLAQGIRTLWRYYERYNKGINTFLGVASIVVAVVGTLAPEALVELGALVALLWTSDATHTFLLVALVVGRMSSSTTHATRADGGTQSGAGPAHLYWALLSGVGTGMVASAVAGDQWVLPGIIWGVTLYLFVIPDV